MRQMLDDLNYADASGGVGAYTEAITVLTRVVRLLVHKVQELEPEEYTEEDMEGFYAEHSRQLEKHNLAHQLCDRVMSSESATNMDTFRIANRLKELLDATKGT